MSGSPTTESVPPDHTLKAFSDRATDNIYQVRFSEDVSGEDLVTHADGLFPVFLEAKLAEDSRRRNARLLEMPGNRLVGLRGSPR